MIDLRRYFNKTLKSATSFSVNFLVYPNTLQYDVVLGYESIEGASIIEFNDSLGMVLVPEDGE